MKKVVLVILVSIIALSAYSQEDKKYVYCELLGKGKLFSRKLTIEIDFGQETKVFSSKNKKLVDENNEPIVFNSMVDAMNYMGMQGWEFVQAYVIGDSQKGYVYHWLLKKDVSKLPEEDQKEYLQNAIKTKQKV